MVGGDERVSGLFDPVSEARDITPHATNPVSTVNNRFPRAIRCNASGNVAVRFLHDSDGDSGEADVTLYLIAGVDYPYRVSHVRATGTTATGIVGLY